MQYRVAGDTEYFDSAEAAANNLGNRLVNSNQSLYRVVHGVRCVVHQGILLGLDGRRQRGIYFNSQSRSLKDDHLPGSIPWAYGIHPNIDPVFENPDLTFPAGHYYPNMQNTVAWLLLVSNCNPALPTTLRLRYGRPLNQEGPEVMEDILGAIFVIQNSANLVSHLFVAEYLLDRRPLSPPGNIDAT